MATSNKKASLRVQKLGVYQHYNKSMNNGESKHKANVAIKLIIMKWFNRFFFITTNDNELTLEKDRNQQMSN